MKEGFIEALIGIIVIILALSIAIIQPTFEAKTFNSCTGSNATYWDAVFTQLRAFECKK